MNRKSDMENPSLQIKLQQSLNAPFNSSIRKSAIAAEKIKKLRGSYDGPSRVKSVFSTPILSDPNRYETKSVQYMRVKGRPHLS